MRKLYIAIPLVPAISCRKHRICDDENGKYNCPQQCRTSAYQWRSKYTNEYQVSENSQRLEDKGGVTFFNVDKIVNYLVKQKQDIIKIAFVWSNCADKQVV
ncbi:MAG: hypothetical protein KUG73_04635 [Pseudomonadales bacterium]|nr:hypothetical protein [Pseudomonadales bacterium]